MTKKKTDFININNARKSDQIEVMENIAKSGRCPFCEESLRKYHKKPILEESKYWFVTTNQWPYNHTKYHFLLIYKEHATRLEDLNDEAGSELFSLMKKLEKEYHVEGGGFAMRFGDTDYSAGSVNHLHVQLVVPDAMAKDFEPVRIKIGLQWEKRK